MQYLYPVKSLSRLLSFVLSAALFFSSCKKTPGSDSNDIKPDFNTKVTASLVSGFVTDENDAPVLNAAVVIGTKIVATDKYGYFEAGNVEVVKTAATVTVNKTGYFKAIKTFAAEAGKGAFFRIKLMPKIIVGTISAAVGGTVTLPNGLAIKFPAGAITDVSTNKPYFGDVRVAAKLMSATDPDLNSIMPGDLRGVNSNNSLQLLTTYGMAAVELSGPAGEFLQISDGKKAILYMPIPASLQANAPASIPLWYFDENSGLWNEQGSAAKTGNMYIGEVSHFSFWNLDMPGNFVQFNCTVKDNTGNPIRYALVKITVANLPAAGKESFTDSSGFVSGWVPANAQLLLEIFPNFGCNSPAHTQQFSTTVLPVSLGTINVASGTSLTFISGSVKNCFNNPVTNGYVYFKINGFYNRFPLNNTATFIFGEMLCGTAVDMTFIAEDLSTSQQSAEYTYTITPGVNITIPPLIACGNNSQQFINYSINGTPYSYVNPTDFMSCILDNNLMFFIYGWRLPAANQRVDMLMSGSSPGPLTLQVFKVPQLTDSPYVIKPPKTVTITEYPSGVGQYLAGNFALTFTGAPPTNTPYNVTCNFRLRRNQ